MPYKGRIRTSRIVQQWAKEHRQPLTAAEAVLWQRLRRKQVAGLKFRRQHPLGPFIADFYCAARRLVIEVDGPIHQNQQEQDAERTAQFEASGHRVIRFSNEEVLNNVEDVLTRIREACGE